MTKAFAWPKTLCARTRSEPSEASHRQRSVELIHHGIRAQADDEIVDNAVLHSMHGSMAIGLLSQESLAASDLTLGGNDTANMYFT